MARSESYSHHITKPSRKHHTTKPSKHNHRHRHWFRRRRATSPYPPITSTPTENSNSSYDKQRGTSGSSSPDQPNLTSPHYYPPTHNSINSIYTPPPTYIPVAPLPIFCGNLDECPVAHLSRFDRVCGVNNVASRASAAHIFPGSLDSYAGIWYDLFVDPSLPWEDVRSAFLSAFRRPDFSSFAWAELSSLRQLDGEAVTRYHLRMQWILKQWPEHGTSDTILKEIFIDGLRDELKELVAPQRLATLDEAVSLAAMWEQAGGSIREARRNAFKTMKRREVERSGEKALVGMSRLDSVRSNAPSVQCQCKQHLCGKKVERNQSMRSRSTRRVDDNGI